jgi:hypothetical protein
LPVILVCFVPVDNGVDGRAERNLAVADDGDACGRRHLLEGVVESLFVLPLLEHQGKP